MIWPWSASGSVAHGAGSLQIISMYFTGDSSPGVLATPSWSVTSTTGGSAGIDSPRAGTLKNFGLLSRVLGGGRHPEHGGVGEVAADDHHADRQRAGGVAGHADGRVAGDVERRRVLHHLEGPGDGFLPGRAGRRDRGRQHRPR